MTVPSPWNDIPTRLTYVARDMDDPALHATTLPAAWEDEAATAILSLSLQNERVEFGLEVQRWLNALSSRLTSENFSADEPWKKRLMDLLLQRQIAPTASLWRGEFGEKLGYVINLAAFVSEGEFLAEQFMAGLRLSIDTLRSIAKASGSLQNAELPLFDLAMSSPASTQGEHRPIAGTLFLTNLDACLAAMGLDYDSPTGRDAACFLAWLVTSLTRQGTGLLPLPPTTCPIPSLATMGVRIRDEIIDHSGNFADVPLVVTGFSSPGPIDALLGVESCGMTPIFSPVDAQGKLRASSKLRLAHRGLTPETALAQALVGEPPLPVPGPAAHLAMHHAIAGFIDLMPQRPDLLTTLTARARLERGVRHPLPTRHGGVSQRATIGGHRIYLRTSEFEDGSLGEVTITPARESTMVRGLLAGVSQAVSIGLQYGAPLDAYVEEFAHSRFGTGGTVEGDSATRYATSLLDYAFRSLSHLYLGKAIADEAPDNDGNQDLIDPLLPLDIPTAKGRRKLRLVS